MIVFFIKDGVYRFVSEHTKSGLLRRESYSSAVEISAAKDFDVEECPSVVDFLESEGLWPQVATKEDFEHLRKLQRFWVIERTTKDGSVEYFKGMGSPKKGQASRPLYDKDIKNATVSLSLSWFNNELNTIRMMGMDKVRVVQIYAELMNKLLSPVFIITCTNKQQENFYLSSFDDNKVSVCDLSDEALHLPYEDAVAMFEKLRSTQKVFLYAVWPAFKDNVNRKDIEGYVKKNNVVRSFVIEVRLSDFFKDNEDGKVNE